MKIIECNKIIDSRGILVIQDNLPFDIKRTFFMFNCNGVRGEHAHHKCRMILIPVKGSCSVNVYNKNREYEKIDLSDNEFGLLLEPEDFHDMSNFSKDCILLVLASEIYNKDDYIYENEFFK